MICDEFRHDNTYGYTEDELDRLNAMWDQYSVDVKTKNYEQELKNFSDRYVTDTPPTWEQLSKELEKRHEILPISGENFSDEEWKDYYKIMFVD